MSEEQTTQKNSPCSLKAVILLTIISLFFSIAALTTSIYTLNLNQTGTGGSANAGDSADQNAVVISQQYDKGRTLQKAMDTDKPMLIFFYTDWCSFCQKFVPTFDKITKKSEIKRNFAIAYVNCEKEENQKIMQEYRIEAYPTVIVVDQQGKRTPLDNGTFFNDDSEEVVAKKALELIGKE